MTTSHVLLLFLCIAAATAVANSAAQPRGGAAALSFNGTEFIHRWSKDAQHEFTPKGEEDLARWNSMVTINVHDSARTGDQLAEVANRVLGNYQQAGKVIRTDSKPRTERTRPSILLSSCCQAQRSWKPPLRVFSFRTDAASSRFTRNAFMETRPATRWVRGSRRTARTWSVR
jgi:hypothetical protein